MSNAPARQDQSDLRRVIDQMQPQFAMALPAHIPVERFARVVMTAITADPDLAKADRTSLFTACLQAANDGLLPDKKEGALIVYSTNVAKRNEPPNWVKMIQWQPMWQGILKKVRNSGQLKELSQIIVYGGDEFRHWTDDSGEHVFYEASETADRKIIRWVVVRAVMKDGGVYIEKMAPADVEKIRSASKAPNSPAWTGWWDQMALKSVFRRLAKRLPLSTDLDDLIRRDDALYDFAGASDGARKIASRAPLGERMAAIAAHPAPKTIDHDPETGEVHQDRGADSLGSMSGKAAKGAGANSPPQGKAPAPAKTTKRDQAPPADDRGDDDFPGDREAGDARPTANGNRAAQIAAAERRGHNDALDGAPRRRLPNDFRDDDELAEAWERGHDRATADADGQEG